MEVMSFAAKIQGQYQSTLEDLRSGTISYQDAMEIHQDLAAQSRGLYPMVAQRGMDLTPVQTSIPSSVLESMQGVMQAVTEHGTVARIYREGGAGQPDELDADTASATMASSSRTINWAGAGISRRDVSELRSSYNNEAFDYLKGYADTHREDWSAMAEEMEIPIDNWQYLDHFYKVPEESGYDVSMGVANSQAEKIFRSIASAEEVANFESTMAPAQESMERTMTIKVAEVFAAQNARMDELAAYSVDAFSPYQDDMAAAGVTFGDLGQALVVRNADGTFSNEGLGDHAQALEDLINTNDGVRSLYEGAYDALTARPWRTG